MLSRGNSEASARLRRAKSSASIKTRSSLSIEPSIPNPFIAKEQALAAAHHAFGRATRSEISPRTSSELASQHRAAHQPLTRSKSIRFAGPTALPGRNFPITMRTAPVSHQEYDNRRQSLYPGLRRHNSFVHGDDGMLTALPSHGEYIETRVASQPSSYRRLRKSKSVFTHRDTSLAASSATLQPNVFQTRGQFHGPSDNPNQQRGHSVLRFGQSFSFRRLKTDQTPTASSNLVDSQASQNKAVEIARVQYLRQLDQQRGEQQSRLGDAATRRRSQKTFRKSVRTNSTNSYASTAESLASQPRERIQRRGIGGKARDLSSSFKTRLKRVFHRSSEAEGTFPAQQLHATRPHFGGSATSYLPPDSQRQATDSLYDITPDKSSSQRDNALHVPRQRGSVIGSVHSAKSDTDTDNGKSRVTSWADSTAENTVTIRQASVPEGLSIIQEDGGIPSRLRPLQKSGALQRILSRSTTNPKLNLSSPRETPETPRHVPRDYDQNQRPPSVRAMPYPAPEAHQDKPSPNAPEDMPTQSWQGGTTGSSPKRSLRESKSVFFPQSTRIERSQISPFRQAMQSSGHSERTRRTSVVSSPLESFGKVSYLSAPPESRERSLTRSESVYSRSSSGNSPQSSNTHIPGARVGNNEDHDHAAGTTRETLHEEKSFVKSNTGMTPSGEISLDRQDLRIGRSLVLTGGDPLNTPMGTAKPERRPSHKREHAQLHGDDTDIGILHSSTSQAKHVSAGTRIRLGERARLCHTPSQPMIDRFPLMSINSQPNINIVEYKLRVSPRTTNQYASENENCHPNTPANKDAASLETNRRGASLASPKILSKMPNQRSLGSKNNGVGLHDRPNDASSLPALTPMTHSRSNPERIARLRRMHSSNTLGSPRLRRQHQLSDSSPRVRQRMLNQGIENPIMYSPGQKQSYPFNKDDRNSDGPSLVDLFLTNRRSPGDDMGDTVFI
ncbi:MAG: hypothetical protein Q9201_003146 [Fulgogasparrea decipioides]